MLGYYSGCDAAIMEFSAGGVHLLTLEDFQTCRSWKMWNFFGGFAAAVASCTATNESGQARGGMRRLDATRLTFAYGLIATLYLFGVSLSKLASIYTRMCCLKE